MVQADEELWDITEGDIPVQVGATASAGAIYDFAAMRDSTGAERLYIVNGVDGHLRWTHPGSIAAWPTGPDSSVRKITVWKGRMIATASATASEAQRVWFSDIGNPQSWPAANFIDIGGPEMGSDNVLDIVAIGEKFFVLKEQSIWEIYDPTNFNNRKVADIGLGIRQTANPMRSKPWCVLDRRLYFLHIPGDIPGVGVADAGGAGIWSTDGSDLRHETPQIADSSMASEIFPATQAEGSFLVADGEGRIQYFKMENDDGLIGYPRRRDEEGRIPWFYMSWGETTGAAVELKGEVYRMPAAATLDHLLQQLVVGQYSDETSGWATNVINAWFTTSWFGIQEMESKERIRRVSLLYSGKPTVALYKDFNLDAAAFSVSPAEATESDEPLFATLRPEQRGRYWRMRVSVNQSGKAAAVYDAEAVYRGGREH
jgi:hypothetical protein